MLTSRGKAILAAAAILGGMLTLGAGCSQTQEVDQTLPPYASISDEGRDPPTMPKQQSDDDNSRGFFGSALHFILVGMGFD